MLFPVKVVHSHGAGHSLGHAFEQVILSAAHGPYGPVHGRADGPNLDLADRQSYILGLG
jgi:hypothetical protein